MNTLNFFVISAFLFCLPLYSSIKAAVGLKKTLFTAVAFELNARSAAEPRLAEQSEPRTDSTAVVATNKNADKKATLAQFTHLAHNNLTLKQLYEKKFKGSISQKWPQIKPSQLTFAPSRIIKSETHFSCISWSPDNTRFATNEMRKTLICDAKTGALIHTILRNNEPGYIAWSRDVNRLAVGSCAYVRERHRHESFITIYDANTATLVRELKVPRVYINDHTWNHDGTQIAIGTNDNNAHILDAENSANLLTLRHEDRVRAIAWNHAGTLVATAAGQNAYIWATASKHCIWRWLQPFIGPLRVLSHRDFTRTVAWSHDDTQLVTTTYEYANACVWNCQTGEILNTLVPEENLKIYQFTSAIFAHRGWVAAASDRWAQLWNLTTGENLSLHVPYKRDTDIRMAHNNSGTQMAVVSGDKIYFLDMDAPLFQDQLTQLIQGELATEQLMILYLFNAFKKQKSATVQPTSFLEEVAQYCSLTLETDKLTIAELARVLLTFHPSIMNALLAHYTVSLHRQKPNIDGTPQENLLDSYRAFNQALPIVVKQANQKTTESALGEYIIGEHPKCAKKDKADPALMKVLEKHNHKK